MAEQTAEQLSAPVAADANIELAASQLSALVDEQLDTMEINLALRRLSRDRGLQARWERYHLISDTLQGHLPDVVDPAFAARLHEAIVNESLPQQPAIKSLPAWYKPVTGFGLAASVALAALVGMQMNAPDLASVPTALTAVSSTPAVAFAAAPARATGIPVRIAALNPLPANDPAQARLNRYLVNHNGYASMNSVQGVLPYVRMVGYQTGSSNR
ncbi:MAG: sigma-E factor negative regulatory protein [Candidatus Contendobacter sp.]|jgi:sigma-E factor negative regulatory protein RseA|nr:sigma-E factor negative regulatory protein [Gammaproteobacteria bacterium]MCC8993817.1 sigma-E factor negative regulatory protein [Candidatus Contendobacter sp.]